ncbi:MAG: hypothetical protein ACC628_22530, partial [Pirellulaceae bacterium]
AMIPLAVAVILLSEFVQRATLHVAASGGFIGPVDHFRESLVSADLVFHRIITTILDHRSIDPDCVGASHRPST